MQQPDPYDDIDDDLAEPVQLRYWSVRELPDGTRYLVGSIMVRGGVAARVSSALTKLDLAARLAISRQGRAYQLVGRRGGTLEADTTWWHFCSKVGSASGHDITNTLIDDLQDRRVVDSMRAAPAGKIVEHRQHFE